MYKRTPNPVSVRSVPLPSHHTPILAKTSSGGPSPRSATPTRIHSPRTRGQGPQHMAPSDPDAVRATTPQRKRNTGRRRAAQRSSNLAPAEGTDSAEPDGSTDDDLFELLGVADAKPQPPQQPAQQPGLLQLSREGMEAATKKSQRKPRRRNETPLGDDTPASSEPDQTQIEQPRRNRRGKKDTRKAADESPAPNRRREPRQKAQPEPSPDNSYDMNSLSRSLPASFLAEAQEDKNKKKEKWDMPADSSPTSINQALTWQQQLQNELTPSKNPRNNGRRSSKAPKAGGHDRRSSLDHVPVSGIAAMMNATAAHPTAPAPTSSPPKQAIPVSAFDSSIPFHTGFNVHRAPQTPIRAPKRSTAVTAHDGVITLPIVGDFPRINRASAHAAPLGAVKYAGPTFHNSPASGSLPKPDLDDF